MIAKRFPIFGEMLMEQLPWVPPGTRRVVIDISIDAVVMAYIEMIPDMDQLTVNALAGLTGGEIVLITPKAGEVPPPLKPLNTSSKTDKLK